MPSGFQNNQDQLTPNYYRIQIDTSTYDDSDTNLTGGGVEPWDYNNFETLNTTLDTSKRRARGNIRFGQILSFLATGDNPEILDVTVLKAGSPPVPEDAADDVAVSVSFTVGYYREAGVLGAWQQIIKDNYLSDNSTYLTTTPYEQLNAGDKQTALELAITEAVVRAITIGGTDGWYRRYRTYDGEGLQEYEENVTVEQPDTPANIWETVTVGLIDTTTQQNF
jgi:hypothetical protein